MKIIVIANPKGGAGKSTLATNLAGYLANQGQRVMLGDIDRQQSAREWLQIRPPDAATIRAWEVGDDQIARPPAGTTHAVLDTPAGLHGKLLTRVLKSAARIIIPVQPSLFDILATRTFIETLLDEKTIRKGRTEIAVVGMRVDARTRAARELARFFTTLDGREHVLPSDYDAPPSNLVADPDAESVDQFFTSRDVPVLSYLRDTQLYVQSAAAGLTLFDLPSSRTVIDRAQWQPIIDWCA